MGTTANHPGIRVVEIRNLTDSLMLTSNPASTNIVSVIDPNFSLSVETTHGTFKVTETTNASKQISKGQYNVSNNAGVQGQTIGDHQNVSFDFLSGGQRKAFSSSPESPRQLIIGSGVSIKADRVSKPFLKGVLPIEEL
jgi:hypothetical protein